jgi:hypothetical protein
MTPEDLVALLKTPSTNGRRRELALKQLGKIAGRDFGTVWDFVAWAERERPDLVLEAPPKLIRGK